MKPIHFDEPVPVAELMPQRSRADNPLKEALRQLDECLGTGWYWWSCFPGCLPDSDPDGPYATEQECIDAFTDEEWEDDDE